MHKTEAVELGLEVCPATTVGAEMTGMNSPQKPNQKLISLLMYLSIEKTFSHGNVQEAEIVFFVLATTGLWNNSEPPRKVPGPSRNI